MPGCDEKTNEPSDLAGVSQQVSFKKEVNLLKNSKYDPGYYSTDLRIIDEYIYIYTYNIYV